MRTGATLLGLLGAMLLSGCGLEVRSADLFLLTRTGQGPRLTLLVNDSGTVRCNGAGAKPIANDLLIQARDLADSLGADAAKGVALPTRPGSVFSYRISLQYGVVRFSDRDTGAHREFAQAELFAAEVAQRACGLSG